MSANRPGCALLLAGLLLALSAQADDKKKQTATRAAPQPVQKQQASPQRSLPGQGTSLGNPKGPTTSGPAGSVNTAKPMAPVGGRTVDGQATGGSAAAGAALGTASSNAKPGSGDTLVNPNATNTQSGGAMPGDFSRERKLQGVVDGGASGVLQEAAKKESNAPGQASGTELIKDAGALPGPGAGKNTVSKRGQQGEEKDSDIIKDSEGNVLGTRGEITKSGKEQNAAGLSPQEWADLKKEQTSGGYTEKQLADMQKQQEKERRGGIESVAEAERMKAQQEKELAEQNAKAKTNTTPNPDSTTDSHAPKNMVGADRPKKTPEQLTAERKRQVTVPNDDKQQVDRMKADQRAAGATMAERRRNQINPGEQGTTGGAAVGGASPAKPGVSRQPESKGGGRTGCPADNPTC